MNWELHTLTAVLAGASAALPAKADQLDTIMSAKTLRCATFADVVPFAAPDPKTREMAGFDVDLCNAIAKELGVKAEIKPVSVEARVPEVKLGRVDITVANLAYTLSRAEQIQFSDPYYLAKEMLIVPADDPGKKKVDYARPAYRLDQGLDFGNVDQAQQIRPADLPGYRIRLSCRPAGQGARNGGEYDDDDKIRQRSSKTKGKEMRMIEDPMLVPAHRDWHGKGQSGADGEDQRGAPQARHVR